MTLLDQYAGTRRSTITKADKQTTVAKLDHLLLFEPAVYLAVLRLLIEFKMHRKSQDRNAQTQVILEIEALLPPAQDNDNPTGLELLTLVTNRSAVWKSDIPATFREYLQNLPNHVLCHLIYKRPELGHFLKKAGVKIEVPRPERDSTAFNLSQRWFQLEGQGAMRTNPDFLVQQQFSLSRGWIRTWFADVRRMPEARTGSALYQAAMMLAIRLLSFSDDDPAETLGDKLGRHRIIKNPPQPGCIVGTPLSANDLAILYLGQQGSFAHLATLGILFTGHTDALGPRDRILDFSSREVLEIEWVSDDHVRRVTQIPLLMHGVVFGILRVCDAYSFKDVDPLGGRATITHTQTELTCLRADGQGNPIA